MHAYTWSIFIFQLRSHHRLATAGPLNRIAGNSQGRKLSRKVGREHFAEKNEIFTNGDNIENCWERIFSQLNS